MKMKIPMIAMMAGVMASAVACGAETPLPANPPPAPLSEGKPVNASSVWGAGYEPVKANDGDDESRWGAAPDARSGWLEVDLGQDAEVACAVIKELAYQRTEAFALECKDGGNWQEVARGNTIAGEKVLKFTPVTARHFRLNLKQAGDELTVRLPEKAPDEIASVLCVEVE